MKPPGAGDFERSVFVNCPFDQDYVELLRPLLFTIVYLGFQPRIALERFDSLELRVDKLRELIGAAKFSIHDLSRLQAENVGEFYRLNMPFELGLDYGCRIFGKGPHTRKKSLILEKGRFDYMKALSDLAGMDIQSHGNEPEKVVEAVRNWLVPAAGLKDVKGPTGIWYLFADFASDFYEAKLANGFSEKDLEKISLAEQLEFMIDWIGKRPAAEKKPSP